MNFLVLLDKTNVWYIELWSMQWLLKYSRGCLPFVNVHECFPQTHWYDVEKDIEWKLTSLGKKLRRELCLYLSFWWCNKKLEKTHWILWIGNMIAAKIGLEQWLSLAAIDENSCFLASAFFRRNNLFAYIQHFLVSRCKFTSTSFHYRCWLQKYTNTRANTKNNAAKY